MNQNDLPVYSVVKQILSNLQNHRAIVVTGVTGCGKSTQIPQILYNQYKTSNILVVVPRKIAVSSLFKRVKQQLGPEHGELVGAYFGSQQQQSLFEKYRIIFISYGTYNHLLMKSGRIPGDYILFDQVHERTSEMDKAMVISKNLINKKINNSKQNHQFPKLVVMSATINVQLFSHYFKTKKDQQKKDEFDYFSIKNNGIHKINIQKKQDIQNESEQQIEDVWMEDTSYLNVPKRFGQEKKLKERLQQQKQRQRIQFQKLFKKAPIIKIEGSTNFQINQMYLDQFKIQQKNQRNKDKVDRYPNVYDKITYRLQDKDIQIPYKIYSIAVGIIQRYWTGNKDDDILIFLPGLAEIEVLKHAINNAKINLQEQQIIIIHSDFREGLFQRIFDRSIKGKIFLATDMAESSITLPNCKAVIDFCLQRKIFNNNNEGVIRLHTQLASKSNLEQRKGRVGRICEGVCVRLIQKSLYQQLSDFQRPDIEKCSLTRTVLQLLNGHQTLKDPYQFLLNVVQPPKIIEVNKSVQQLLNIKAIQYTQKNIQKDKTKIKFNTEFIKVTDIGKFFLKLSCESTLANLILHSFKFNAASQGVNIASIISANGRFFIKFDRRVNFQQSIEALITYDYKYSNNQTNCQNDFLLMNAIFQQWRQRFFSKYILSLKQKQISYLKSKYFKNSKKINISNQKENQLNQEQKKIQEKYVYNQRYGNHNIIKFILKFSQKSKQERQFCQRIGVQAKTLREILHTSQILKNQLQKNNYKIKDFSSQKEVGFKIKLCLLNSLNQRVFKIIQEYKSIKENRYLSHHDPTEGELIKMRKRVKKENEDQRIERYKNLQNPIYNQEQKLIKFSEELPQKDIYNFLEYLQEENNGDIKQIKNSVHHLQKRIKNQFKIVQFADKVVKYVVFTKQLHVIKILLCLCYKFRMKTIQKKQLNNCSIIFQKLMTGQIKFPLQLASRIIWSKLSLIKNVKNERNEISEIKVGNDSINQVIPHQLNIQTQSYLIANQLVQANKILLIPSSCLVKSYQYALIKALFCDKLQFKIDQSNKYVTEFIIDKYQSISLTFYCLKKDMQNLTKLRIKIQKSRFQICGLPDYIIDQLNHFITSMKGQLIRKKDLEINAFMTKLKKISSQQNQRNQQYPNNMRNTYRNNQIHRNQYRTRIQVHNQEDYPLTLNQCMIKLEGQQDFDTFYSKFVQDFDQIEIGVKEFAEQTQKLRIKRYDLIKDLNKIRLKNTIKKSKSAQQFMSKTNLSDQIDMLYSKPQEKNCFNKVMQFFTFKHNVEYVLQIRKDRTYHKTYDYKLTKVGIQQLTNKIKQILKDGFDYQVEQMRLQTELITYIKRVNEMTCPLCKHNQKKLQVWESLKHQNSISTYRYGRTGPAYQFSGNWDCHYKTEFSIFLKDFYEQLVKNQRYEVSLENQTVCMTQIIKLIDFYKTHIDTHKRQLQPLLQYY